jgi:hypothetical protein
MGYIYPLSFNYWDFPSHLKAGPYLISFILWGFLLLIRLPWSRFSPFYHWYHLNFLGFYSGLSQLLEFYMPLLAISVLLFGHYIFLSFIRS